MAGPRHAEDRWFWPVVAVVTLLAIAGGWIFYRSMTRARNFASMSDPAREELADLHLAPIKSADVEREWVSDLGAYDYLLAPVGPLPCPGAEASLPPHQQPAATQALALRGANDPDALAPIADGDPDNLLVALIFGTELINAGRHAEASRVIGQTLDRTRADNNLIERAKAPGSPLDLGDADVSTVIHLYHAASVAQLQQAGSGAPWVSLKNVIGCVKALSDRRLMGTTRGEPTWSKLAIAAPGCTAGPGSLSSYDLYNNLIVAYMKGGYTAAPSEREREFARPRGTNPRAVQRLLVAQIERARENGWKHESELWALSNVERVLDWRRPDDARINMNAIAVIDWWLDDDRCPKNVCTDELRADLAAKKDELLEQALLRHNVAPDQQRAFAQAATRWLAQSQVDRARVAAAVEQIRTWLPPAQSETLGSLTAANDARQKLPRWIVGLSNDEHPPEAKLDRRAEAWRRAADVDFVDAAAVWAKRRTPAEQEQVIVASRQLLGGREAPPSLRELELKRGVFARLRMRAVASKGWWLMWSLALAFAAWLVAMIAVMAVRDWRLLQTSFYNVELEHLRASAPPPRKRGPRA